MELDYILSQMEENAEGIRALVAGRSDEEARWRPDAATWSILEVVNHLLDEEREDFRARIDLILHRPDAAWFPIDPEGWVTERGYNERDLTASLEGFLVARKESLDWLMGLSSPDWEASYPAPFGRIRAGDVLASWAAHDLFHIRQLVELRWAYLLRTVEPYGVRYAGVW
jgi:hypothetical protein